MCDDLLVAAKEAAGAPAEEIEITPEMIEPGVAASRLYDREDPKSWEVAAVYEAMERHRRARPTATGHH